MAAGTVVRSVHTSGLAGLFSQFLKKNMKICQTTVKQMKLSDLEAMLDPRRFVRIHRSYILNIERLERLELYAKDSRVAILRDGARIPVSRSGYAKLKILL